MTRSTIRAAVVVGVAVFLGIWPSGASGQTPDAPQTQSGEAAAPAHKDAGRHVKVILTDGTTSKFTLVNLTASELVVQRDPAKVTERIALSTVYSVRASRPVYTIAMATGFAALAYPFGYALAGGGDEGTKEDWITGGVLCSLGGAALGAWLGHVMDSRPHRGTLIYSGSKPPKKTLLVSPTVSRILVGAVAVVRW